MQESRPFSSILTQAILPKAQADEFKSNEMGILGHYSMSQSQSSDHEALEEMKACMAQANCNESPIRNMMGQSPEELDAHNSFIFENILEQTFGSSNSVSLLFGDNIGRK